MKLDRVATFLLKKTPFTASETRMLKDTSDALGFTVMYLPGHPVPTFGDSRDNYTRLLLADDRHAMYDAFPLEIAPTTDDRPFFFHYFRWEQTPTVIENLGRRRDLLPARGLLRRHVAGRPQDEPRPGLAPGQGTCGRGPIGSRPGGEAFQQVHVPGNNEHVP